MSLPALPLVDGLRHGLGSALRSRIEGDDNGELAREIWETPGERWFDECDPIWRVHADASMLIGGLRSLLIQTLHPLAMAGVAGHSGYKGDPWGRLQRTGAYIATTTFGTVEAAERTIAQVRGIHRRVKGTTPDGRPYAASDPHLLRWVHVTEVDSFLRAYRRHGSGSLTAREADRYVAQVGISASRLGVVEPPQTVAEVDAELEAFRPELESTPAARETARFLLLSAPVPLAARPAYAAMGAAAVAMLPSWARTPLRLPYLPLTEQVLSRTLGTATTQLVRWAMTGPPELARGA